MDEIFELDDSLSIPKYLQLVKIIGSWINTGVYKCGDKLPSINELSAEFEIARDTVDKAFADLKERGIVFSTKGKGFYVAKNNVKNKLFVGLFFNRMTSYNEAIYDVLYNKLKEFAFVDLMIYHNSVDILEEQIARYSKAYDYFVVIPTVHNEEGMMEALSQLPRQKIIIIKRVLNEFKGRFAAIYQDFYSDMMQALNSIHAEIGKYETLRLIYHPEKYSSEILRGFISFCRINRIDYTVQEAMQELHKGEAYILLDDNDMMDLIHKQREAGYELGKEVGIISYEDSPVKSLLSGGITAIRLNNQQIGELTAEMILTNNLQKIRIPFSLIKRKSL